MIRHNRSTIKETTVKSTKTVKEAYVFLGLTLAFLLTWISSKTPNSLIPIVITHFSFNASLNLVDARGLGFGATLSLLAITAGIYLVTAILVWSASGWSMGR